MISQQEAKSALNGAWRLARLDLGGLNCFDRSEIGLRRSFAAAIIAYPLFLMILALTAGGGNPEGGPDSSSDPLRLVLVETIGYVAGWAAIPLIMLPISNFLGRAPLWGDFVIVYNWAQVVEFGVQLLIFLLVGSGLFPPSLSAGLVIATQVAILLYEWLIARVTLSISGVAATMVVLAILVLDAAIQRVAIDLR